MGDHRLDPEATSETAGSSSPAYLVFCPFVTGTAQIVAFGPGQYDEARTAAERIRGLVVQVPVAADYR